MTVARNNPFATERIEALLPFEPTWIGESWPRIFDRLDRLEWRGAVVGPHGSGKTTFLETLAKRLLERKEEVVPLFLNRQARAIDPEFFDSLTDRSIILFDGAEQLGRISWRRFLRRTRHTRGLIVTTHRPGRLPTVLETETDQTVLQKCLRILADDHTLNARELSDLFHRHHGNIRHALLECYDNA